MHCLQKINTTLDRADLFSAAKSKSLSCSKQLEMFEEKTSHGEKKRKEKKVMVLYNYQLLSSLDAKGSVGH